MTRHQPKQAKTSRNNRPKFTNDPKWSKTLKLGKSGIFYWLSIFKLWAQMPNIVCFVPRIINFLILTKLCLYPILKVRISNLTLLEPKSINFLILTKVGMYSVSKVLISNLLNAFENLSSNTQILILTKFLMYLISKVLISNLLYVFENFELKSTNLGFWTK